MSELGSSFVQEGGPYEWMKLCYGRLTAGFGAVLYWITNPLWVGGTLCFLASSAFSEYFIHLGGPEDRVPRRHPARRPAVQAGLHLDQHRRRDRCARPRQVDPELRRGLPCLRAAVLLVHRADLRVQARHQRLRLQGLHPGRDVGLGHPGLPRSRAAAALQLRRLRARERSGRGDGRSAEGRAEVGHPQRDRDRDPVLAADLRHPRRAAHGQDQGHRRLRRSGQRRLRRRLRRARPTRS